MAIAVTVPGSSGVLTPSFPSQGIMEYKGFALAETGAAAAKIRIREGGTITGKIIDVITFTSLQSFREYLPTQGVIVTGGLYIEVVSGAVEGSIRID